MTDVADEGLVRHPVWSLVVPSFLAEHVVTDTLAKAFRAISAVQFEWDKPTSDAYVRPILVGYIVVKLNNLLTGGVWLPRSATFDLDYATPDQRAYQAIKDAIGCLEAPSSSHIVQATQELQTALMNYLMFLRHHDISKLLDAQIWCDLVSTTAYNYIHTKEKGS